MEIVFTFDFSRDSCALICVRCLRIANYFFISLLYAHSSVTSWILMFVTGNLISKKISFLNCLHRHLLEYQMYIITHRIIIFFIRVIMITYYWREKKRSCFLNEFFKIACYINYGFYAYFSFLLANKTGNREKLEALWF